jgi:pre-rRNA-processing protein TSR3
MSGKLDQDRPRILVYMMKQDDPRKCTASHLARKGLAIPIRRLSEIRDDAIVLNPASPRLLLRSDRPSSVRSGLVAIDCSWERAGEVFMTRFRGSNRKLPSLMAANPTNYARIGSLSTAEALAAALYVVGFPSRARQLLSIFSWGGTFFDLNGELLERYSRAKSEQTVAKIELDFGLEPRSSSS